LEDILHVAETSGIKVVLSTVASNERDCSPFASHLSAAANDRPITEWRPFVEAGLRAESNADFTGAISNYLAASTAAAMFADVQFRLGRSYLALRNPVEARRRLELARDYDSLPFRADSHINGVIRDVAAKRGGKGFSFVDAAETIAKDSPQGIAGNEFFYEHVHLNFEGNYRLARIVADGILPLLPDSISKHGKEEWAAADLCNRRLALSDWDRYRVYDNIGHRLLEPPFVNQSSHPVSLQKNHDELVATRSYFGKEALKAARLAYQEALSSVPEDFYLHGNYAKLMEDTGDAGGAVKEWERVRELLPYEAAPYYYLGRLAARQKKNQEAIQMLSKALEIRPNLVDALDEKGRLLTTMGRTDDALIDLREAFRLQPGNSRVAIHMADALAAQGKKKEAMDYLIRAVTAQPSNWEAHYYLGVELAVRDRVGDAAKEFGEVVRLRPEFPLGHLNLAIALAKAGKVDDAIKQLNETLRLDPKNEKARQYAETLRAMRPLDP
jgi:tetratricopeptide (TPR) repeat protein